MVDVAEGRIEHGVDALDVAGAERLEHPLPRTPGIRVHRALGLPEPAVELCIGRIGLVEVVEVEAVDTAVGRDLRHLEELHVGAVARQMSSRAATSSHESQPASR